MFKLCSVFKRCSFILSGRLGLGTQDSHTTPQAVPFPEGTSPCLVNCGVDCSMIITLDNKLFCCGSNRLVNCPLLKEVVNCFGVIPFVQLSVCLEPYFYLSTSLFDIVES